MSQPSNDDLIREIGKHQILKEYAEMVISIPKIAIDNALDKVKRKLPGEIQEIVKFYNRWVDPYNRGLSKLDWLSATCMNSNSFFSKYLEYILARTTLSIEGINISITKIDVSLFIEIYTRYNICLYWALPFDVLNNNICDKYGLALFRLDCMYGNILCDSKSPHYCRFCGSKDHWCYGRDCAWYKSFMDACEKASKQLGISVFEFTKKLPEVVNDMRYKTEITTELTKNSTTAIPIQSTTSVIEPVTPVNSNKKKVGYCAVCKKHFPISLINKPCKDCILDLIRSVQNESDEQRYSIGYRSASSHIQYSSMYPEYVDSFTITETYI